MPRPPSHVIKDSFGQRRVAPSPVQEFTPNIDPQLNQLRQNLSLIPEGRELLDFADKNDVRIVVKPDYLMPAGSIATTSPPKAPGGPIMVDLNIDMPKEHLTLSLAHELRHANQLRVMEQNGGIPRPDTVRDVRTAANMTRLMEADAFTYQGVIAVKLAQAGHPEFLEKAVTGEFKGVRDFLKINPPESFKNDQALARGIFGHMLTERLDPYNSAFFSQSLGNDLMSGNHHDHVGPHQPAKMPYEALGKSEIARLYGVEQIGGVSPRALEVGLLQSMDPYDRKTIRMTERLTRETGALTRQEYETKTQEIQERIKARPELVKETPPSAENSVRKTPLVKQDPLSSKTGITGSSFVKTQARLGKSTGVADVAISIAEGRYAEAAVSAGQQVAMSNGVWKAAADLAKSIAPVAKSVGFVAKRIPLVGGAVTAGYVMYEVGANAATGEYGKAGAALAAGAAEALGNTVGFGVGDGAREIVRGGVIAGAGEKYAPEKSGLRRLAENGVSVGSRFMGEAPVVAPENHSGLIRPSGKPPQGPKLN